MWTMLLVSLIASLLPIVAARALRRQAPAARRDLKPAKAAGLLTASPPSLEAKSHLHWQRLPKAGLSLGLGTGLTLLVMFLLGLGTLQIARASHPGGLQIGLAGTSTFFMDSNGFCSPPGTIDGPDGIWLPVVVTNTTAVETYTGLQLTASPPANTLADDAVRYLGTLGPGMTTTVFYFFDYTALRTLAGCTDGVNGWYAQPYTLTLTSLTSSLSAPSLFTDIFDSISMISAAAGGVRFSDVLGPGAAVGQVLTQSVVYNFGQNPANSQLFLQPSGNGSFNDQCFRLVGSAVTGSTVPGVPVGVEDTLFFPSTDTGPGADTITIEYQWLVLCSPGMTSQTFAWAEITSGTQFKYNGGGYGPTILPLPIPLTSVLAITKTVSPANLPVGGVATYTLQFANSFTQPIYLSRITDTLAAGIMYGGVVNSLSNITAANSSISPTVGATGTLVWFGIPFPSNIASYRIPASSSIFLIYTATITSTPGSYTNQATAVVGNLVFGPVSATVTVGAADISIAKTDTPDPVVAGQTLTYTLVVNNAGPSNAANVAVTDTLPVGVTFVAATTPFAGPNPLVWSLGTLAVGASRTLTVVVTVDPAASGTLLNTAIVGSPTPDPDPTDNTSTITTTVGTSADLSIVKSDNPDPVTVGGTLTYTLVVNNAGPSSAAGVTVTDTLPAGVTFVSATPPQASGPNPLTWSLGTLAVGASRTLTVVVTVDPATSGVITNTATVGSPTPDPDPTDNTSTITTTVSTLADLSLVKVSNVPTVTIGSNVIYTIIVNNAGPGIATNVSVSDTLPAAVTFVSATPSPGAYNPATGLWTVGTIANGASATLQITVTVTSAGAFTNTAQVATADQPDPDSTPGNSNPTEDDQDSVTLPLQTADLSLSKSASPSSVNVGQNVTFTIVIANSGPDAATGVEVSDLLPAGLAFVSALPSQGSYVGGVWTVGTLANGATATLQIVATVNAAGPIANTAQVSNSDQFDPDSTPANNNPAEDDQSSAVVTGQPLLADLSIVKSDSPDPVVAGQTLTYTLLVSNAGPSDAASVTVTDTLPAGMTLVAVSSSQGGCVALPCNLGTLAAGSTATVTVVVRVTPGTTGVLINSAGVSSPTPDPDPTDNTDDEPTTSLAPGVLLDKQVTPGIVVRGQPFTYTLRITNTASVTIDPLIVTDTLPSAAFSYLIGSGSPSDPNVIAGPLLRWNNLGPLAPGQSLAVSFAVTATPGLTGTYVNVATVEGITPGGSITDTDDAPIALADPSVEVVKRLAGADLDLTAPNFVTFTIQITNTGPSVINTLPLIDVYDPSNISFVSATPTPNEPADDGQLAWYDLTAAPPNGFNANLAPGQSFLITTVFRVAQDITTTINTAIVTGATDVFNNPANDDSDTEVINNIPTSVELLYFRVDGVAGRQVRLAWATAAEIDNFGFNVYRAPADDFSRAELIHFEPSAIRGGASGATYAYTDTVPLDGAWWYWLADLDTRGFETLHAPVDAHVSIDATLPYRLYVPVVMWAADH